MCKNEYTWNDDGSVTLTIISDKHGTKEFLIDKEDSEEVMKYHWTIFIGNSNNNRKKIVYAITAGNILLHRFITNAPKGMVVDHLDGNSFDNRKTNLKVCTYSENNFNKKETGKKSCNSINGVCKYTYANGSVLWHAYISEKGKQKRLGSFKTEDEAVMARRNAEKQLMLTF